MKAILLTLLTSCLLLTGCSQKEAPETSKNKLESILDSGKLTVTLSPDYPPMEFLDKNGNPVGSDVALAQFIADELGVELVIETMEFGATYTALDFDKADLSISGYGWQQDRQEAYELSIAYNNTEDSESSCQGLIIRAEDDDKYQTLTDFSGTKVAAQVNSIQEAYTTAQIPDVQLESVQTIDVAMMSLATKKVDAVAISCNVAKGYELSDSLLKKALPEFDLGDDALHPGNYILAKKGETELIEKVNEILEKVNNQKLYETWDKEAKDLAKTMGINFE